MTSNPIDEPARPGKTDALSLERYKDLLVGDLNRIRLHDALVGEIQTLVGRLSEEQFRISNVHTFSFEDYLSRVDLYEATTRPLLPIMAAGGYWSGDDHARLLCRCVSRLADPSGDRSGNVALLNLRRYPALLAAYASGIGAILSGRYTTLAHLLLSTRISKDNKQVPLIRAVAHNEVIDDQILKRRPEMERRRTPTSDHLFNILKEPLNTLAIDDMEYQAAFDRFEYLYALSHGDFYEKDGALGRIWGPIGCFLWRQRVLAEVELEIAEQGSDWPPLKVGFFGGSVDRAKQVKKQIDEIVHRMGW